MESSCSGNIMRCIYYFTSKEETLKRLLNAQKTEKQMNCGRNNGYNFIWEYMNLNVRYDHYSTKKLFRSKKNVQGALLFQIVCAIPIYRADEAGSRLIWCRRCKIGDVKVMNNEYDNEKFLKNMQSPSKMRVKSWHQLNLWCFLH